MIQHEQVYSPFQIVDLKGPIPDPRHVVDSQLMAWDTHQTMTLWIANHFDTQISANQHFYPVQLKYPSAHQSVTTVEIDSQLGRQALECGPNSVHVAVACGLVYPDHWISVDSYAIY